MTDQKIKCSKCNGSGHLEHFAGHARGVCFQCKGSGSHTETAAQMSKAERELAERKAAAPDQIKNILAEAWELRRRIDSGDGPVEELKHDLKDLEEIYHNTKGYL